MINKAMMTNIDSFCDETNKNLEFIFKEVAQLGIATMATVSQHREDVPGVITEIYFEKNGKAIKIIPMVNSSGGCYLLVI